ncbi:hypothetical protein C923_02129 [Plasmodium falciparum UGT5.1]|uniref:Erythrocyte membrane protein 1 n=1 Tax=Plasmodium falciparum UGT5.1 TaxID=1237627 RepID=W7JQ98_PLAFA|nr:hypothetical protein C923_02129 [Plasmodium falciparum UGT5.1]
MVTQSSGGGAGGKKEDESAKHMFDRIGKDVYDEIVKNGVAEKYKEALKGKLSLATFSSEELAGTNKTCKLVEDYRSKFNDSANGGAARGDPCKKDTNGNDVERFSVKEQAEYDNKKMKCSYGSNGKNEGACASFRRLHLCNKNMEKMDTNNDDSSKAKHKLLAEVCLAAKFEGESIKHYSEKYDLKYPSSGSSFTTCTMLARSFADIGDIVRGRDLYLGKRKKKNKNGKETETERDQLEKELKEIFGKIHDDVTNGSNGELKTRYNDTENYYQLREDWWEANRKQIWQAMTCSEQLSNASYFHATCGDSERSGTLSQANNYCRCNGDKPGEDKANTDPPTYFDYVPQYLRWFEEWAEDFCRKKKIYVDIVKKFCREGDDGNKRYCSRNGLDCEKTKLAIGKLRYGKGCTDCFFACNPYVEWIEKQKEQFDKQKERYDNLINGTSGNRGRQKRDAGGTTNYEGYEKKFYDILKTKYNDVNDFLKLLNKENVCKEVKDDKGGTIHFENVKSSSASGGTAGASDSGTNNENEGTFYRSEYCQPCPYCGVKKKENGEWKKKKDDNCKNIKLYKPRDGVEGTKIEILKSGENRDDIKQKIEDFCTKTQNGSGGGGGGNSDSQDLYQKWKCYQIGELTKDNKAGGEDDEDDDDYDGLVTNSGGLCILQNKNKNKGSERNPQEEPAEIQKTFYDFFYYWVAHMLKDSIYWRTKKLDKCLQNGNKKCGKKICNGDCECFQRWIDKKKTEWGKIKEQFSKQNFGNGGRFLDGLLTADFVLEGVLQIEFLKGDSEEKSAQDNQNSLDSEEIQHLKQIKKILDDEKKKNQEAGADGSGTGSANGQKTIMDKLIDYEQKEAKKCLEKRKQDCQEPQQPGGDGGARSLPGEGNATSPAPPEDDDDDDEDDDDDDVPEKTAAEVEETTQDQDEKEPEVEEPKVEGKPACEIVKTLFNDPTKFSDACTLKYGPKAPTSWKCIPTSGDSTTTGSKPTGGESTKSSDTGGLCIPPRRRKLYVGHLEKWANSDKTEAKSLKTSDKESSQDPSDKLREAFIQSAAVETFFLWHKYIEEKKPPAQEGARLELPVSESDEETPQTLLQSGKIPPDFLRQMFYTLGDYRDICVGVKDDVAQALKAGGIDISTINEKIKKTLNSDNKETGGTSLVPKPGNTTPESWWKDNAPHIWNGMICALTYTDNTDTDQKGGTPKQDQSLKSALLDDKNKPKKNAGPESNIDYTYEKVELKDENSGTKQNQTVSTSGEKTTLNNPKLSDFVLRPPYFRYLEEWGETFCRERAKRLEKIKDDCKVDEKGKNYCDGEGFECIQIVKNEETNIKTFDYPSCAISCRNYKKWINKKRTEFEKQEKIYDTELNDAKSNNEYNGLSERLKTFSKAGDFLASLKGPCSKTNNDYDNKGDVYINFGDKGKTFGHENYCDPCSQFKVNCQNGKCCGGTNENCKNKKITEQHIKTMNDRNDVVMRVSDNTAETFPQDLNDCKGAGIFTGIKENKWTCGKFCGLHVCGLKGDNGGKNDQIILVRALFKRWIDNFLEDYNKIKKKLKPCMNSGEGSTCKKCCEQNCKKCVDTWIKLKKDEWKKIKKEYLDEYKSEDEDVYPVKTILEERYFENDIKKAIKPCPTLEQFERSSHCNGAVSSQNGKKRDIVECLLDKLEKKAKNCPNQPSDENQTQTCEGCTPVEDDDEEDLPLEEEENTVGKQQPSFCPKVDTPKPEEGGCEPAPPGEEKKDEKKEESEEHGDTEDQHPALKPEEEAPVKPAPEEPRDSKEKAKSKPRTPRTPQIVEKSPLPEIVSASAFPLTVGVAFAALSYFVLKKKTKSTIDLLRVINIPKGDYGIPTLKSTNRYIPYGTDRYKGKTYIYMEGDTDEDKYTFMSDTSDITSSSESEYEEIDINDIYVPGSPKYKTLIEVVLEPSKRDATNTPNDIPLNDKLDSNKLTDEEWNQLKKDFISKILQNPQKDLPQNNISRDTSINTHPHVSILHDSMQEKPFITSIHDRDLHNGDDVTYNINLDDHKNMNFSTNHDNISPKNNQNNLYTGIDLINDSISGNHNVDIYDELLKRKENELFGTNHTKHTTTNIVAKQTLNDPILNQINLFHKWLDRHKNMCEQWDKNKKEELLDKLKKEWEQDYKNNSDDIHNRYENVLNTDVSIQINMNDPKPINEFTNMDTNPNNFVKDTILDDLDKHPETYFYDIYDDDITYFDIDDEKTPMGDIHIKEQTEMNALHNNKMNELLEKEYPISDIWNI